MKKLRNFYQWYINLPTGRRLGVSFVLHFNFWLLFDVRDEEEIKQAGYNFGLRYSSADYEITKLDIKFINPKRREAECTELVLAELVK